MALGTADLVEARRLVSRLSVRWEALMVSVQQRASRGYLTASEANAVFKCGMDDELGRTLVDHIDGREPDERIRRVLSVVHRVAQRLAPDAKEMPEALLDTHAAGLSAPDRRAVVLMLGALEPHKQSARDAQAALTEIGAPVTPMTLRDARVQLLRGRAEAQERAALAAHASVQLAGDPHARLLDDDVVVAARSEKAEPIRPEPPTVPVEKAAEEAATPPADIPFLIRDKRRLSEVIDSTISAIQASGDWNPDISQRRRVIQSFCWITGDKPLCDYGPHDAELFAQTLRKLPKEFRWGTPEEGAMSRPFAEVMAEVAGQRGTKRNVRTLNRDLTTMSRFARELAKTAWKTRYGSGSVIDFTQFSGRAPADDPNDPDRMPYTDEQLITMFSSPIYMGGGGCARRLKADPNGVVYQDAAYWVPLLLVYGILSREEACGVECQDFVFDVDTPFVAIVENMTKSLDGENPAGLKRRSRHRMVPLHPELLRLGLRKYVEAMEAEGNRMIFPELYGEYKNRGGKRFYAGAGRYIIDYVDGITPLLRTSAGKRADLHSMRTTGGSALEDSDVKQLTVDDILGHAREGTGPRKYSKAWFAKGGGKVLKSRLEAMVAALPVVTSHLRPVPLRVLPMEERSRTGSAKGCVSRKRCQV